MDRVQALAKAIAHLPPGERERLFELLAKQDNPALALGKPTSGTEPQGRSRGDPVRQPDPDYVLIFDGGSRGNPGWGYGSYVIVRTQDGAKRLRRLELGDEYTNNEAEYDTLIAALEYLVQRIEEGGRQAAEFALEVRGDSSLVINQLTGRWRAKDARMQERRDRCLGLLKRFGSVDLKAQPREESVRVLGH